ncbi:sentrin-specific protease 7b isoform X2 [Seriola aureovittata]|uniref:sentrin-specific protease 7b isoform X2 n=1 Tax=Seriola aureovittata TaxID=2871759 RepID=UPI0024BD6C16|nr:sentrin-specific protease 7b isoform X2 [Seriola aureovittata]
MASVFKIPKKKQPTGSDSTHVHLQSPLSRLQSPAPQLKAYGDQSSRGGADRMHAGNTLGSSTNRQRNVVKTLLGLTCSNRGAAASAANHRSPGSSSSQSQPGQRAESSSRSALNGWRPKRASHRLLQPEVTSEHLSPPQKKKTDESSGSSSSGNSISVASVDSLAKLRGEEHAGSRSPSTLGARLWRRVESGRDAAEGKSDSPLKRHNSSVSGSDHTSEDDSVSPSTNVVHRPPSSSSSSSSVSSVTAPDRRRSLDQTAWKASGSNLMEDVREKERRRWREFRERKTNLQLRLRRKPRQSPAEPIVLSSEEEEEGEEGEDDGDAAKRTSQSASRANQSHEGNSDKMQGQLACSSRAEGGLDKPPLTPPSFLQLEFSSLHAGLTHADASGKMMITEDSITVPLKVSGAEKGEVTVVASQVRGYGVWDGGVAQGGALLTGWEGPAPSLLFLWVTEAQANLLHRELSAMRISNASGPSCSFLLVVLKEQLQELHAALLASILDMEEYKKGRSSSSSSSSPSSGGPTSPLDWTDGLLLLHSCPPPLDQHLLGLLGHSAEKSREVRSSQRSKKSSLNSSGLQQLPTRLIQYPAAPCRGRISVTKEDLACLDGGEFLNDVIIDFYLKYLLLEGVGGAVAERSHVFSSFFYKQLSRRRAAGEDDTPSVPDRHMRHQRVKTWTRHVDIFTQDFLFVPVNQEAHWYLVVVCFPGLEKVQYEELQSRTETAACSCVPGGSERAAGKPHMSLKPQRPPECTEQGRQRDRLLKRPCILVMDSLKLSYHENVCRLLRDYLQVEWEVRRGTPRLFTSDNMRSSNCRVPQQDNSSDCGLYLLQYAESFLQNPVVHFALPVHLDHWFPRQRVRQKREEIRSLIMRMHESQQHDEEN